MSKRIVVIALTSPSYPGLYLHGLRRDNARWSLPGGHMTPGEIPLEAARRELEEETGITGIELKPLHEDTIKSPNGDLQVYLFTGEMPDQKLSDENDPDHEFMMFKFLNPRAQKVNWHVPPGNNILIKYLNQSKKDQELQKMSRPVLQFPKLGAPTRLDQEVQLVTKPKHKELFARKVAHQYFKDLPEPRRTQAKQKAAKTLKGKFSRLSGMSVQGGTHKPSMAALAGKQMPTKVDVPKPAATLDPALAANIQYPAKSRVGVPDSKLTPEQRIDRGRRTEAVIQHEAAHGLFGHVARKYGPKASVDLQRHLIGLHMTPKVVHHIGAYLKKLGYKLTPGYGEEIINALRDILVDTGSRNLFKQVTGNDYDQAIKEAKQGWNKLTQAAKQITPDFFKKAESLIKAPIIHDDPENPMTVIRVQNKEGHGPYTGADIESLEGHGSGRTPAPHLDPGFTYEDRADLSRKPGIKFGFKSRKEMKKWFTPEEMKEMAAQGFKPTKMQASKVWSSGSQLFFQKFVAPHRQKKSEPIAKTTPDYKAKAQSHTALLFPVSLGDRHSLMEGVPLHSTIKVFGESGQVAESDIHNRIQPFEHLLKQPIDINNIKIQPHKFQGRNGETYHVLLLDGMPKYLHDLYHANRDVGFTYDEFKPHITIDKETWDKVNAGHLQPKDIGLKIHPPELRAGNKTLKTY